MDRQALLATSLAIRSLTIDAIEKARSGHPGLPLGCAEIGAALFGEIIVHFPGDPNWINRDRFVLSAGHGSMLLYSLLFLSGYITLEDLQSFRKIGSKTPGHPEYGVVPGVEVTTGPLGQGVANAVGMAIAERMLSSTFNTQTHNIIDHYTYVLVSDGDMMEGVCAEAASLAGHLGLAKLIVLYDSNGVTIDGATSLTFTEDVPKRFTSYGWNVLSGDAHDPEQVTLLVGKAKSVQDKPSLIVLKSIIAKGSPKLAGKSKGHSGALGDDELKITKKALGIPENGYFYVPPEAYSYFEKKKRHWKERYDSWNAKFAEWKEANPTLYERWSTTFKDRRILNPEIALPNFTVGKALDPRKASGEVLRVLMNSARHFVGGAADVTVPVFSSADGMNVYSKNNPAGQLIRFGVREHAMGAIANGLALYGCFRPFCGTFLVFSDYMRPAIRLACMMQLPVIYLFSHDSVHVGEDGPTHQPVEQLASLRLIPGLWVLRPADAQETVAAWELALERTDGPTAIILARQPLETFRKDDPNWNQTIKKGAYIARDCVGEPDLVVISTGSEVQVVLRAVGQMPKANIRVVSIISRELFLAQPASVQQAILPPTTQRIVVEAGVASGWEAFFARKSDIVSIERFGQSGPGNEVASALGVDESHLIDRFRSAIASTPSGGRP